MFKGLLLTKLEDAWWRRTTGEPVTAGLIPDVEGLRLTSRFLGATNEKIRALKAESLVDTMC